MSDERTPILIHKTASLIATNETYTRTTERNYNKEIDNRAFRDETQKSGSRSETGSQTDYGNVKGKSISNGWVYYRDDNIVDEEEGHFVNPTDRGPSDKFLFHDRQTGPAHGAMWQQHTHARTPKDKLGYEPIIVDRDSSAESDDPHTQSDDAQDKDGHRYHAVPVMVEGNQPARGDTLDSQGGQLQRGPCRYEPQDDFHDEDGDKRPATTKRSGLTETSSLLLSQTSQSVKLASGTPCDNEDDTERGRDDDKNETGGGEQGEERQKSGLNFCNLSSRQKGTFLLIAFSNFFACTCFSLLAPFFPAEATAQGMSQTVIGLVFSCFELVMVIFCPFVGKFMNAIGPKFVFVIGQFVAGACSILFGLLYLCPPGVPFIVLCFVLRIVKAIGAAAFVTASYAVLANEFPSAVSTVFGILEVFTGLGYTAGPLFGGILYEAGGFGLPFYVMGTLLIACSVTAQLIMKVKAEVKPVGPRKMSMFRLAASPLVAIMCFTIVCGCFTFTFMDASLAVHLQPFNLSASVTGLMFVLVASLYAAFSPVWGRLSDKMDMQYVLIGGNLVGCLALLLLGPSPFLPLKPELWLVIVSLTLLGPGVGATIMPTLKYIYKGARRLGYHDGMDLDALVSGLLNSAIHGGGFLGPTIGSPLVEAFGYPWASTFNAGLCLFSAFCLTIYITVEKLCLKYDDSGDDIAGDVDDNMETTLLAESPRPHNKDGDKDDTETSLIAESPTLSQKGWDNDEMETSLMAVSPRSRQKDWDNEDMDTPLFGESSRSSSNKKKFEQ